MNVTKKEEERIREMLDSGIDVEIRMIPLDTSIDARHALNKEG